MFLFSTQTPRDCFPALAEIRSVNADPYQSVVTTLSNQYVLSLWSLKDDDYQTSYDDQRLEHGVQQEEAPEEEEEEVGGEEQQEEEEEEGSQAFDTEEVCSDWCFQSSVVSCLKTILTFRD